MLRWFKAVAMPSSVVVPLVRICSMIGRTSAACWSAAADQTAGGLPPGLFDVVASQAGDGPTGPRDVVTLLGDPDLGPG
jgi:hypothetical protein